MICLRCGYCCTHYLITILEDPDDLMNVRAINALNERCPHLEGDKPGEYSCRIHEHPNYELTSCKQFDQIGRADEPCRLGQGIMKDKED